MSSNSCLTDRELLEIVFCDELDETCSEHLATCSTCAERLGKVSQDFNGLEFPVPEGGERAFNTALSFLGLQSSPSIDSRNSFGEILTIEEVANFLKVEIENVRFILPLLPHFLINGHIRVRRAALDEFISRQENLAGQSFRATLSELSLKRKF